MMRKGKGELRPLGGLYLYEIVGLEDVLRSARHCVDVCTDLTVLRKLSCSAAGPGVRARTKSGSHHAWLAKLRCRTSTQRSRVRKKNDGAAGGEVAG